MERHSAFMDWKTWLDGHLKTIKVDPDLTPCTRINFKWIEIQM